MASPQHPFKQLWNRLAVAGYTRTLGIIAILVIAISVPLTLSVLKNQTNTQQHAGPNGTVAFSNRAIDGPIITTTADPNIFLNIGFPDNWNTTQASLPLVENKSIIQKAYAQDTCSSNGDCNSCTGAAGCWWANPGGCQSGYGGSCNSGASSWAYTTSQCNNPILCAQATVTPIPTDIPSGGGGGLTPTVTPQPQATTTPVPTQTSGGGGGGSITASDCQIDSRTFDAGINSIQMTLTLTGQVPAGYHTQVFFADNNNMTASSITEVHNWTRVADAVAPNNPPPPVNIQSIPLYVGDKGFNTGNHWVRVQVINTTGNIIIDGPCGQVNVTGGNGAPTATPTQSPAGTGTVTLYQIAITNIDGGSGGHVPVRITGATDLRNFLTNPSWTLNTSGPNPKRVQVDFYDQAAAADLTHNVGHYVSAVGNITLTSGSQPGSGEACPAGTPQYVTVSGTLKSYVSQSDAQNDRNGFGVQNAAVCIDPPPGATQCPPGPIDTTVSTSLGTTVGGGGEYIFRNVLSGGSGHTIFLDPSNPAVAGLTILNNSQTTASQACVNGTINFKLVPSATLPTATPGGPTLTPTPTITCATYNNNCTSCTSSTLGCWFAFRGTQAGGGECRPGTFACQNGDVSYATLTRGTGNSCSTPTSCTVPGVPTPTARPSGTPPGGAPPTAPTTTPVPAPISSVTPGAPGSATLTFSVVLNGIGKKGATGTSTAINNDNPNQKTKDATVYLYDINADPSKDPTGAQAHCKNILSALVYNDRTGQYDTTDFNLGNCFTPGTYQVLVKSPTYLRKKIGNIALLNGKNSTANITSLPVGDSNGDNIINIADYQYYLTSCLNKPVTDNLLKCDYNNDGFLDHTDALGHAPSFLDFRLFQDNFANQAGD